MKKISIFLVVLVTILASCKKNTSEPAVSNQDKWEFDQLSIKKEIFAKNDSTKKGMELTLEFNYPVDVPHDSILKEIQHNFIIAFAGDLYGNMTPEEAFNSFEKKVEEEALELGKNAIDDGPDFGTYFNHIKTTVLDTTAITITAKSEIENYTGGAHGLYNANYFNIDLRTGKLIGENDLFKGGYEKQITELLENKAKTTKNSMGDEIMLFEPVDIQPNGNFYFTNEGIVYVYNQYEIAPYSEGLIEIIIPYENVQDLIAPPYKTLITAKKE